ncbi:MAG TPA: lantibiotic dehydratase, partial [Candidatus Eisenbacteria bacterium]|nr:lantibiotic dehydratase [Candidatus Eisenbacteria bacterium]
DATWSQWIGAAGAPRFACAALFQVAARDVAARVAGRWRAVLNALYPGVGLAVSRLAWLHAGPGGAADSPIARDVRAAYAGRERAGAVLAEISFMHGGRTANAGLRPPLLEHEILLLGDAPTPGHVGIPLSDLGVRWDSADARFVLRSHALGCEVVPVLTSGVSPEGLASFLVAVGRQGEQPVAWFPGFEAPAPMRWPRVVAGRTVLFRRRWTLAPPAWAHERDAALRFAACDAWRESHGLPTAAFVHSSVEPKPFAVDLASPPAVAALATALRALPATACVEVTEMLPGPEDAWVADVEGRHAAEFLVHVQDERASTAASASLPVTLPA